MGTLTILTLLYMKFGISLFCLSLRMLDVEDNLLKARGNVLTEGEADELLEIIQEMNVMIVNLHTCRHSSQRQ